MSDVNTSVAESLTTDRLADDLERIANDVRFFSPDERAARLREAVRRLCPFQVHRIDDTGHIVETRRFATKDNAYKFFDSCDGDDWTAPHITTGPRGSVEVSR